MESEHFAYSGMTKEKTQPEIRLSFNLSLKGKLYFPSLS